jgi:hypothetical protein
MNVLQKIVFTVVMVVGLSIAVSAQKDEKKKVPPKSNPPVVHPAPSKPPPNKSRQPDAMVIRKEVSGATV